MATAGGDGRAPYETTGAGGKFRKRPFRRTVQATPYDRPPTPLRNTNSGLFTKLVDPASRLIYAGAHRLFGAFRKRLPPLLLQGLPPEINEEAQNVAQEAMQNDCNGVSEPSTDHGVNSVSISAAGGISELEQMLKQKTFTRSEIQRLTALLHSKTTESPSDDVERDGSKVHNSPAPPLRLEASTSGTLKKYGNERDNFYATDISTPVVTSRVLEEEIGSPAELAKAYMGSRPMKVAPSGLGLTSQSPRQDVKLLNNASGFPKTPISSMAAPKTVNSFRGLENGYLTPRSRGRSAMYSMARTPYSRGPSTFNHKEINSDYGHGAPLTSSLKRRSSVLEDDIGSGGPLRRTRQKPNLLSQGSSLLRDKRELGYTSLQQPDASSQKLFLMNKPEPKVAKDFEENGDTSMRVSSYATVPTKSTQMATKILEQLERLSPKEKKFGSTLAGMKDKSPSKLTLNMLHGQALRSLEKVDSPKLLPIPHDGKKTEGQHLARLQHDIDEPASKSKDKVEENSSKKFPIPRNMLTPVNGDSTVLLKDKAPVVISTASTSKVPAEPPQKKRAFQMSALEDSFDLDDDIHVNGTVSFPSAENNNKPEAPLVANKPVFAEVIQTPTLQEVPKTSTLAEITPVLPEVAKIPEKIELKEAENVTSLPKTDIGFLGGSVNEQGMGFKFPTSPPSTTTTQTEVLPQSTLQTEKLEKDSNNSSLFGSTAEKVSPFQFSANETSEIKSNSGSDLKALDSTSVFNSVSKNDTVKFPAFNKDENGDDKKAGNMFGKPESLSSPALAATSTSGFFSFGNSGKNSSTPDETPASSTPPMFSSFTSLPVSGANLNSLFNNSSSNVTSASTATAISTTTVTTTTTAAASTVFSASVPAPAFSTSLPAPVFSFGSAIAPNSGSAALTSVAQTGNTNEKETKSNIGSSPFASTSFATTTTATGSSLFGFSSPAATSTTNNQSQASFFNVSTGSQANTQTSTAVTQSVPFMFGSSTPSIASSTSGSSFFGSSAPAFGSSAPSFGISSVAASSDTKSSSSTSGSSTSLFGSAAAWQAPKSSGFGSTFSSQSPVFGFGASSTPVSSATTSPAIFGSSNTGGSTGSSMFSFAATTGATNSTFGAPSSQGPLVFGNPTPVFGATATSPNHNDQMSMEDSMAEDSMQSPTPVSQFGQAPAPAPGFMFGSATPTPAPAAGLPFQFGGQPNQPPVQNPFQSSSVEFNGGGSFSLGSGGDKSGRRIVRVKNKNRRK